jgi:hypothetical protein
MQRAPAIGKDTLTPVLIIGGGLLFTAFFITSSIASEAYVSSEIQGGLRVGPLLFLLSLPVLARQARKEGDRKLFALLAAALFVKLLGAALRYYFVFDVYEGVSDVGRYHSAGVALAAGFRQGIFDSGLESTSGSFFIELFTGIVYTFTGPTMLGGFMVYSWLCFWGMYYSYKAFLVAVPDGDKKVYGRLLFLLPSMLFWPSSIGKDALMVLALGLAAYGVAKALTSRMTAGLVPTLAGVWLGGMIRPHVVAMLGIGVAAAYVLRRPKENLRELGPVVKLVTVSLACVAALVVMAKADTFLEEYGYDTDKGIASAVQENTERTTKGGSEFDAPSVFESPANAPLALVTVLFRPLPIEAEGLSQVIAGIEGLILFGLVLWRLPWIWAGIKQVRNLPFVGMAVVYCGLFVAAFSSMGNFAILARERVMLFPFLFVLMCVPREKETRDARISA